MASGRPNGSGTKGFNFASDDILRSYEDYDNNQDGSNGRSHSDPAIGADSSKEFCKTRMARSSSMFPSASYSPPEESSLNQDMISAVDKSMKKYADNLMRFLEGISSRLSELELYCYNLDKSIGEMRSDLNRDHGEADSKLIFIEKHLQEVHRSVQILRDKQELADTQKELTKLQVTQKEPSNATNSQQNEERVAPPPDVKKGDNTSDMHGQQLALTPPHQVAPQPSLPSRPAEQPQQPPMAPAPPMSSQSMMQAQGYYLAPTQMTNLPGPTQVSQGQYMHPNSQYQATQMQDQSMVTPQTTPSQVNQTPHPQSLPQYQQQWPQQVQQLPQSPMQPQVKPSSAGVYPSYVPSQPNPPPPHEMVPNSSPMQGTYSGVPPSGASRSEQMPYGYGGAGRPVQPQPPPQHLKPNFSTQPGDGYVQSGSHPTLVQGNTYIMYDEGGRPHHPQQPHLPQPHQPHQPHQQQPHQQQPHQQQPHQQQPHQQPQFSQGGYPPSNLPVQNQHPSSGSSTMNRPPQFSRNVAYNELIEKLVSMGYRGDHAVTAIQRLEESGQTVDFNSVLDKLNGHSSGGSQRGWSG